MWSRFDDRRVIAVLPTGTVTLLFSEFCERIDEAIAAERRIKGWSRAKKEAYMRGDFELLSVLARRRGSKRAESKSSPFGDGSFGPSSG